MRKKDNPETSEDRKFRLVLQQFLELTNAVLDRVQQSMSAIDLPHNPSLERIWHDAQSRLKAVTENVKIGLNKTMRDALKRVGLFGDILSAKLDLLKLDIGENRIRSVLKRLNSMLGSLAEVFSLIHAVKEYKEQVEVTIEEHAIPMNFTTLSGLVG